jgi:acetylornithine deacetylase
MGRALAEDIILEHRVTAYLEGFFRGLGVAYERQTVAPGRDNIIARTSPSGTPQTLILEAHQDTVPIDNMTIAPFAAAIEGNRLYGRGACDIKGGLASMLAAFARLAREKPRGAANVVMACSVDEEHTFLGVQHLVKKGIKADMAVVAEPTSLNIVHAHKGVARWVLTVPGRSCHSSSPEQGTNAIYRMGRLLLAIEAYADHLRTTVIDPLLGPATLSVGRIEGGTSVNTVPDRCRIEIDRRLVRGENQEQATVDLKSYLTDKARIDFPFDCPAPWMSMPPLNPQGADQLILKLGQAIDQVQRSHRVHAVPYGTDASTLAAGGIPSVVFGPGDIVKAHTADEWVPLDEVEAASEILFRLACALE